MSINTESMGDLKDRLTMEKMDSVPGCFELAPRSAFLWPFVSRVAYARVKARWVLFLISFCFFFFLFLVCLCSFHCSPFLPFLLFRSFGTVSSFVSFLLHIFSFIFFQRFSFLFFFFFKKPRFSFFHPFIALFFFSFQ